MIYGIVEEADWSAIKIGYTSGPVTRQSIGKRLNGLQTGTWRRLTCIAACSGTKLDEQALHWQFRHHHLRGEWFAYRECVVAWVEQWMLVAPMLSADGMRAFAEPAIAPPPHTPSGVAQAGPYDMDTFRREVRRRRSGRQAKTFNHRRTANGR